MSLFAVGLNHTTAPLEVREKVVFTSENLTGALRNDPGIDPSREGGRRSFRPATEPRSIYGATAAPVASWLAGFHGVPERSLARHCYTLPRAETVTHAFRVASGLDSMVLGEPQILGQMKHAVRSAESAGSLGLILNRLFQRTSAVAKEVRNHTGIGMASVSMAAATVKLQAEIFGSISDRRVLFVGAGEMMKLPASHFLARSPRLVTVANRTLERGRNLADRLSAEAITSEDSAIGFTSSISS